MPGRAARAKARILAKSSVRVRRLTTINESALATIVVRPMAALEAAPTKDVAQLEKINREGSIWNFAREGNVEEVKGLLGDHDMSEQGPMGETLLHIAVLFKQPAVVRHILSECPECVNDIFSGDEYYGETALHMAIINRDHSLVRFLCETGADVNGSKATGHFFQMESGTVYYGEHPMCFALCTKQVSMLHLLHEYDGDLSVTDCQGNTLWHHSVRMNSPTLFDTLVELASSDSPNFEVSDLDVLRNNKGFSVFQFAAYTGNKEIFQHLLEYHKIVGWEWGDVSFCAYPIQEIDTHGINTYSVLETIITERHSNFMDIEVIEQVLQEKWDAYGKFLFFCWMILHIGYCLVLSILCTTWPFDNNPRVTELSLYFQLGIFVLFSKTFFIALLELWELYQLVEEHGSQRTFHIYFERGYEKLTLSVTGLFKTATWMSVVFSVMALVLMVVQRQFELKYLFAVIIIVEWLHTLMFAQAFKATGRLVLTISKILVHDVSRFMFIYSILLAGFSVALSMLVPPEFGSTFGKGSGGSWLRAVFVMYELSLGVGGFFGSTISNPYDRMAASILYIVFLLLSCVMLFNLMIAVMTETTDAVRAHAKEQWKMQWASTVLLMERRVPRCFYKRTGLPGSQFGFFGKEKDYFITFTQVEDAEEEKKTRTYRSTSVIA